MCMMRAKAKILAWKVAPVYPNHLAFSLCSQFLSIALDAVQSPDCVQSWNARQGCALRQEDKKQNPTDQNLNATGCKRLK